MRHRDLPQVQQDFDQLGIPMPETLEDFLSAPYGNPQLSFLLGDTQITTGRAVDEDDLERAKELIAELNITVGILERYAESLAVFEHLVGRQIPSSTIEIQNQSPDRLEIDAATRDWIARRNHLDVALYEFAAARFDAQVATLLKGTPARFAFEDPRASQTNPVSA